MVKISIPTKAQIPADTERYEKAELAQGVAKVAGGERHAVGDTGHLRAKQRTGEDQVFCAPNRHFDLETETEKDSHLRIGRAKVPIPAQGQGRLAIGRASDAAIRFDEQFNPNERGFEEERLGGHSIFHHSDDKRTRTHRRPHQMDRQFG